MPTGGINRLAGENGDTMNDDILNRRQTPNAAHTCRARRRCNIIVTMFRIRPMYNRCHANAELTETGALCALQPTEVRDRKYGSHPAMRTELLPCPNCDGEGLVGYRYWLRRTCVYCHGAGEVSPEEAEWIRLDMLGD